jgi:hypothetical protein
MKRFFCALFVLLIPAFIFAQWSGYYTDKSELDGGLGMTWIDNHAYYTIAFQPDIQIGKVGVGLGINLLYSTETGKIRSQDWNSGNTLAHLVRYLRYGQKGDPFYTRIGALDAERIGHGFILNNYNNQINYDERKIGLSLDADFGPFGFESMTNNLGRLEVVGGRGYVRPLFGSETPILKRFAIGASVVTDAVPNANSNKKDRITEWGIDAELPFIKSDALKMMLYADHAQIVNHGHGETVGIRTDFNTLWGFLGLTVDFERRMLGGGFIAEYFGPFYEVLRYTTVGELVGFYESMGGSQLGLSKDMIKYLSTPTFAVGQSMLLDMMNQKRNGWYGALDLDFFHLVRVIGAYQKMDDQNNGALHIGGGLAKTIPLVDVQASYDKRGITTIKDLFTLDYRSFARVGVGYKIKPYLLVYMDYIWSFAWDQTTGQFKPQERVQPRLSFRYPFSL